MGLSKRSYYREVITSFMEVFVAFSQVFTGCCYNEFVGCYKVRRFPTKDILTFIQDITGFNSQRRGYYQARTLNQLINFSNNFRFFI